jgi:DNA polymerase III gamma/tau subunit
MLENGTLPHSILITGPSGCGKTSLARIIKTRLGCSDMDFEEINAAEKRGIDDIRAIQRVMGYHPAAGPVRVWLIDETHRLTGESQSALLKMTEEPPSHVYFIFATTDPQKLIPTLRSRFSPMTVRLLHDEEAKELLQRVMKKEKLEVSNKVLDSIILSAQGSARVLLVLLEKISNLPEKDREKVIDEAARELNESIDLCRAMMERPPQWKKVAKILSNMKDEPENIRYAVIGYARSVLLREGSWFAYNVIKSLEGNLFDSKNAGLAAQCFEACHASK